MDSGRLDMNKIGKVDEPFSGKCFSTLLFKSTIWQDFIEIMATICEEISHDNELLDRLEAEHFDVAIAEMYNLCPFALFHRIGARTKLATLALTLYQISPRRFGIPSFSSYATNIYSPAKGTPNMGFWERLINFYNDIYEWAYLTDYALLKEEPILRHAFGQNFPSLQEIGRNISLLFVNSNHFLELPRPISNKVIHIGGILEYKSKPLEPAISAILDQSRAGVVLISFGSFVNTRTMPRAMILAFLRAFSRFSDFEFIWKLDIEEEDADMFKQFRNVHPVKWMDQKSILKHPKLRAFVSHCGLNSISEAAQVQFLSLDAQYPVSKAGVPILAIPIFADQLYNAVLVRHKGMATLVEVQDLHGPDAEHRIWTALDKILHDPQYRANAQLIRRKMELSPFPAREKLVKWVEFAAEFPELNELNLPWEPELGLLAYYSIDAILVTVAVAVAIIWVLYKVAMFIIRQMRENSVANSKKLKKN